jgi:AcrR family transcriptional regulator
MNERADTKSKILDAAERLFGIKGFDATSLRDITAEADVNLAAVNYHFQSKDSLIDAVVLRRIEPVNRRRFEMLDAAGPNPAIEQILAAFIAPVLQLDLHRVVPLLGRTISDPQQFVERVFNKHLQDVSRRFNEALSLVLPDLPPTERLWRLNFTVGVMTHVLSWSPVFEKISGGLCTVTDREALLDRIVNFTAAGFRASLPQAACEKTAERKD